MQPTLPRVIFSLITRASTSGSLWIREGDAEPRPNKRHSVTLWDTAGMYVLQQMPPCYRRYDPPTEPHKLPLSRDLQSGVVICSPGEKVLDDPRSAIERPAAFSGMADGASPVWRSIGALARPAPMVRRGTETFTAPRSSGIVAWHTAHRTIRREVRHGCRRHRRQATCGSRGYCHRSYSRWSVAEGVALAGRRCPARPIARRYRRCRPRDGHRLRGAPARAVAGSVTRVLLVGPHAPRCRRAHGPPRQRLTDPEVHRTDANPCAPTRSRGLRRAIG